MKKLAIWQQIYETLIKDIGSGHYPKGEKLPTEAALAMRFDVNRHTIRRALAALSNEGAIYVRQGSGAYVSQTMVNYPLNAKTRFSQNLLGAGLNSHREILRLETIAASRVEAQALHLPEGALVHVFEAVSIVDKAPFSYSRSIFPASRLPDMIKSLGKCASVTKALAENGVSDYSRDWTKLTAKRAEGTVARVLHVPEGSPILRTVGLNIDAEKRPVEYGRSWFHADRAQLVVEG